jgi:hypothetical protein
MEPKKILFRPVTPNGPLRISPIRLTEGSSTKCRAVLPYVYVKLLTNDRVVLEMTENSLTEQICLRIKSQTEIFLKTMLFSDLVKLFCPDIF